jgi:hypothetical protein
MDDDRATVELLTAPSITRGMLDPIADHDTDAQLWMDCELCSLVENRFHQLLDPQALTADQRAAWSRRALAADERLSNPRQASFLAPFWIIDGGVRVGTVGLWPTIGRQFAPVVSLYVFPGRRSAGHAYRALRSLHEAATRGELAGIRLATEWTWQAAVRRYLFRYRMWAWSFKRSIDFVWASHLPKHSITITGDSARFAIEQGDLAIELIVAGRDGDRLTWNEVSADGLHGDVRFHARSTFAVALAVHGWPLLRAGDDVDEVAGWDIGGPDVLARKIAIFEWLDRRSGFDVRAPRIPGLPYDAIGRRCEEGA